MNFEDFEDLSNNFVIFKKEPEYKEFFTLTKEQLEKCKEVGKFRTEIHKNHNPWELSDTRDIAALVGEYGFGKPRGLEPDWSTRLGGDKFDFVINGNYIDCKSSEHVNHFNLKQDRLNPYNNWIYVFCRVNIEKGTGSVVGWIKGSDIKKVSKLEYDKEFNIYFYRVYSKYLTSMKSFDEYVSICRGSSAR